MEDHTITAQRMHCFLSLRMIPTSYIKAQDLLLRAASSAQSLASFTTFNTVANKTNSFTPETFSEKCTRFIHNFSSNSRRYSVFTAVGAMFGISWWVINDLFLSPHGKESSFKRYLFAHAIQGGLMLGTLYHPAAIGYGMIAGVGVGKLLI